MYAGRKGSLEVGPGCSGASPHLCSPRLLLVSKTTYSPAEAHRPHGPQKQTLFPHVSV